MALDDGLDPMQLYGTCVSDFISIKSVKLI